MCIKFHKNRFSTSADKRQNVEILLLLNTSVKLKEETDNVLKLNYLVKTIEIKPN